MCDCQKKHKPVHNGSTKPNTCFSRKMPTVELRKKQIKKTDKAPCVEWTSLSNDITQNVLNVINNTIVNPSTNYQPSVVIIPYYLFIDNVIKRISCLRLSQCAKQNFIRSVMDIPFLSMLNNNAGEFSKQSYEAFIETVLISISTKWCLYADNELRDIEFAKNCFFEDIMSRLPAIQVGLPPASFPIPDQITLDGINDNIKKFVRDNLL